MHFQAPERSILDGMRYEDKSERLKLLGNLPDRASAFHFRQGIEEPVPFQYILYKFNLG
jgi:hypothetical protein